MPSQAWEFLVSLLRRVDEVLYILLAFTALTSLVINLWASFFRAGGLVILNLLRPARSMALDLVKLAAARFRRIV